MLETAPPQRYNDIWEKSAAYRQLFAAKLTLMQLKSRLDVFLAD